MATLNEKMGEINVNVIRAEVAGCALSQGGVCNAAHNDTFVHKSSQVRAFNYNVDRRKGKRVSKLIASI
jgi:hypothetical protein